MRLLSSGHYTGPAPHWIIARLPGWEGSLEDIYIDRRDKTLFIVVIGWNKGFIFIGEDMVLTALKRSPRSKVQRSSAVLEFPPLSGTPSLLVRTSNWSLSTRTCKEHWLKMRCALILVAHCLWLCIETDSIGATKPVTLMSHNSWHRITSRSSIIVLGRFRNDNTFLHVFKFQVIFVHFWTVWRLCFFIFYSVIVILGHLWFIEIFVFWRFILVIFFDFWYSGHFRMFLKIFRHFKF